LDCAPPGGTLYIETEVAGESTRIHIYALDASGQPAANSSADDADSFLSVAGTLVERLGGHLDIMSPDDPLAAGEGAAVGYVLRLPR
jgi:hypothetical protein